MQIIQHVYYMYTGLEWLKYILAAHAGYVGREGGRDELFSGLWCLFLEQTSAMKATAAPCHCCHGGSENRTANMKPVSHSEVYEIVMLALKSEKSSH